MERESLKQIINSINMSTEDKVMVIQTSYRQEQTKREWWWLGLIVFLFIISIGAYLTLYNSKDYCTPDNSKESKIVQNMQLNEKTTELEMQYRERFDSLQNYIDLKFPVKIINKVSEIPKSWEIRNEYGIVIQKGKIK